MQSYQVGNNIKEIDFLFGITGNNGSTNPIPKLVTPIKATGKSKPKKAVKKAASKKTIKNVAKKKVKKAAKKK